MLLLLSMRRKNAVRWLAKNPDMNQSGMEERKIVDVIIDELKSVINQSLSLDLKINILFCNCESKSLAVLY